MDTAGATLLTTDDLRVASFRWVSNGAAAGDQVVVQDGASRTVWEDRASGANFVESEKVFGPGFTIRGGMKLTTLGSGKLYVYYA